MANLKESLDFMNQVYTEQVKDVDEKGYADLWRETTEIFFEDINDAADEHDIIFTFIDIDYLDGYFIFGTGTNSVVHFHITECPGWKFGIWWDEPEDESKVTGHFFAQFEEIIDKFKPSASTIKCDFSIHNLGDRNNYFDTWSVRKLIEFIHNEPYLAFCRDYCCYDYNETYLSREEAKEIYDKYRTQTDKENELTIKYNTKILKWVEENILPRFNDARIEDMGEYVSPRYNVVATLDKNSGAVNEAGVYSWFNDEMSKDEQNLSNEFDVLMKEAEKAFEEIGSWYFAPIHKNVYFIIDVDEGNEND